MIVIRRRQERLVVLACIFLVILSVVCYNKVNKQTVDRVWSEMKDSVALNDLDRFCELGDPKLSDSWNQRWMWEKTPCQGWTDSSNTPNPFCKDPKTWCSGGEVTCKGINTTCHGEKIECTGKNLNCPSFNTVCHGDAISCFGNQMSCLGDDVSCSRKGQPCQPEQHNRDGAPLPVLYKDLIPDPDQYNIYLMETMAIPRLPPLMLCAVESYCLINPDAVVWMLTSACRVDGVSASRLEALKLKYPNLRVATLNVAIAIHSTFRDLYESEIFWESRFLPNNLGNLARMSIVYRSGGLYSDFDVIAWRSVTGLKNYIGKQSKDMENNALFHYEQNHPFVLLDMQDMVDNFQGNQWSFNGPTSVTRVLDASCDVDKLTKDPATIDKNNPKNRLNITGESDDSSSNSVCSMSIFPPETFYPISWKTWEDLFKPRELQEATTGASIQDQMFPESYGIHLSNHVTKGMAVPPGSVLDHVVSAVCPVMLSAVKDMT